MKWILKPTFQSIIDKYVIFDNPVINALVITLIVVLCGTVVYKIVGVLYREGIISGRNMGSIAYWGLLLILVVAIIFVIKGILIAYAFLSSIPIIVWIVIALLLGMKVYR